MSDFIIHCAKGRLKVIGHSIDVTESRNGFFQTKAFKWLKNKNAWSKQARYYSFNSYGVEGIHQDKDGNNIKRLTP